jgi:hypothetical protein
LAGWIHDSGVRIEDAGKDEQRAARIVRTAVPDARIERPGADRCHICRNRCV